MKLTATQRERLNRTREQWQAVRPDAFLTGSIVQARNVIEMARADILVLFELVEELPGRTALSSQSKEG